MNKMIHDKYHCDAPPVLGLQSDNGPECKNITINAWCTLLAEMNIFEKIYVNYLIAGTLFHYYNNYYNYHYYYYIGHTHDLNDQVFSVIDKKLESIDGSCVLTPLGLVEFIKNAIQTPTDKYKILAVDLVDHMYDFSSAIKKYINPKIKGHLVSSIYICI
jgi:hypothetical protein